MPSTFIKICYIRETHSLWLLTQLYTAVPNNYQETSKNALCLVSQKQNGPENLKDERHSNALLAYHVTSNEDFTCFEPVMPQYKRLKNEEFVSLTLKIMDQAGNIITDGLQVTVVLHIHDHKI